MLSGGAQRDIPSGFKIQLNGSGTVDPAAIELTADGNVPLGTAADQINVTGKGSFSGAGGIATNVNVTLTNVTGPIDWADEIPNLMGGDLMLGSRTGLGSVTLMNDIDFGNAHRTVYAYASNDDPDFFSKLGGTLTGSGQKIGLFLVQGTG